MTTIKTGKISSWLILVFLLSTALILGGCNNSKNNTEANKNAGQSSQLSDSLTIAGSTSVQPFSEILAEAFMTKNTETKVNVQGGGSSQGVAAAISGAAQIGSSSRVIKAEEIAQGVVPVQIAIDGIAVIVNPANTLKALTTEEIKNIYRGNVKNWKELGGADAAITVVTREEASGTRDAFISIVMGSDSIVNSAIVQNSTGAIRTMVAGDKNAIGYISLAKVNQEVAALKIDGIDANETNVLNGTYTLQRPFIYVTKGEPDKLAAAFIEFVLSDEGQKIIEEEGAYRVNK